MANNFLEQIKRAREAADDKPTPQPEKRIKSMTDAELEEAERAARRQLLDAQHAELREREIARVAGPGEADLRSMANEARGGQG